MPEIPDVDELYLQKGTIQNLLINNQIEYMYMTDSRGLRGMFRRGDVV